MRPVDRGSWPLGDRNEAKEFHPYRKAKRDLLERLGGYCSYCERTGDLHVEHIVPKCLVPALEEEWTNFLLGCVNCNSIKSKNNDSRIGYVWPDQDDTKAVFEYLPEGLVRVRADLPERIRTRAQALFDLVGLGRRPGNDPRAGDLRWLKRRRAWWQAVRLRGRMEHGLVDLDTVVEFAQEAGFWSVWMTVFADHVQVCDHLRRSFPGTK